MLPALEELLVQLVLPEHLEQRELQDQQALPELMGQQVLRVRKDLREVLV